MLVYETILWDEDAAAFARHLPVLRRYRPALSWPMGRMGDQLWGLGGGDIIPDVGTRYVQLVDESSYGILSESGELVFDTLRVRVWILEELRTGVLSWVAALYLGFGRHWRAREYIVMGLGVESPA